MEEKEVCCRASYRWELPVPTHHILKYSYFYLEFKGPLEVEFRRKFASFHFDCLLKSQSLQVLADNRYQSIYWKVLNLYEQYFFNEDKLIPRGYTSQIVCSDIMGFFLNNLMSTYSFVFELLKISLAAIFHDNIPLSTILEICEVLHNIFMI